MKTQKRLIKQGDIILLGDHVLACGSSTDINLVKRAVNGLSIDVILTDPPYGVDYVTSKQDFCNVSVGKNIKNDAFCSDQEYVQFTKDWISPIRSFLNRKNTIYIFNSDKMIFALKQALQELKIKVSQLLIWVKDKVVIGRLDYLPQHELILYGWDGVHKFKGKQSKSVLYYPKPHKSPLHPTMKPLGLLRHILMNSSDVGDVVYDPFAGSGSTLIACEHTKRKCISVEYDIEYCHIIIKRWEGVTGRKVKYERYRE